MDHFIFDGVDSRQFDAYIFDVDSHNAPAKQVNTATIPGRSGDLLLPGWRFGNVTHSYDVIILRHFERNYEELRNFLLSREGYCRLEDSIHPDEFYTAYFASDIQPEHRTRKPYGKFRLTFTRKPQRWLKSGEQEYVLLPRWYSPANPTKFGCYPLITLKCKGETITGDRFTIYIWQYNGDTPANSATRITMPENDYCPNTEDYLINIDMETLQTYVTYPGGGLQGYYNKYVTYRVSGDEKYAFQMGPDAKIQVSAGGENYKEIRIKPRWYTL